MRYVSITDFIAIVHGDDSTPPSPATVRRQCSQKDAQGRPRIPGAYKAGKPWKIDLDVYEAEMARRMTGSSQPGANDDHHDDPFLRSIMGQ